MRNLHARQQSNAVERNNHMVVKLPDDADGGIDPPQSKGAVTDKTV